jgi:hypothetical protein
MLVLTEPGLSRPKSRCQRFHRPVHCPSVPVDPSGQVGSHAAVIESTSSVCPPTRLGVAYTRIVFSCIRGVYTRYRRGVGPRRGRGVWARWEGVFEARGRGQWVEHA